MIYSVFVAVVELRGSLIGFDLLSQTVEAVGQAAGRQCRFGNAANSDGGSRSTPGCRCQRPAGACRGARPFSTAKLVSFVKGAGVRQESFATKYARLTRIASQTRDLSWRAGSRMLDRRICRFCRATGFHSLARATIFKSRPDVPDYLKTEKCPVLTEDHGVVLNFSAMRPRDERLSGPE